MRSLRPASTPSRVDDAQITAQSSTRTPMQAIEDIRHFAAMHNTSDDPDSPAKQDSKLAFKCSTPDPSRAASAMQRLAQSANPDQSPDLDSFVLAALACLRISCKLLECEIPRSSDLIRIACNVSGSIDLAPFNLAEKSVLATLTWDLLMSEHVETIETILDCVLDASGAVCGDRTRRLSITLMAFGHLDPAIECGSAQRLVQLRGCQTLALISNHYPVLRGATLTHALLLWNKYIHRSARNTH